MSSTRDFKSPGIFAEDATTTIPPTPIAGVAYRDAINGADDTPNGWRYGTRVESQDWNQVMYLMTSLLSVMDKKGILGWSNLVDYTESALCFGSDGKLYVWLSASGPAGVGAKDPTNPANSAYWADLLGSIVTAGDIKVSAVNAAPTGWLICDGAAISRTTYAGLFSAIGTTYGAGNGTTTFNVPDLRGEFVRGFDGGRGVDPSRVFGSSQKGTLVAFDPTVAALAVAGLHTTGTDGTIRNDIGADIPDGNYPLAEVASNTAAQNFPAATAAGVTRPRNVAMTYLIKT